MKYIIALWYKFKSNIDARIKRLTILPNKLTSLVGIFTILGVLITFITLYSNSLKPPKLGLTIGKRVIVIWHDNLWKSAPMIDVYCTISNDGAKPIVIDNICIELNKR